MPLSNGYIHQTPRTYPSLVLAIVLLFFFNCPCQCADPRQQIEAPDDPYGAVQDLNMDVIGADESVEEFVYGNLKDWISQELRKMCSSDGNRSTDDREDDVFNMEADSSNVL
ncbi:uncharacterized protein LOC118478960 [Aplysia californica]|uniref:Uncharacterized protein LOC118478960 n=1 Tax=Aplysia californica TaxID=6500 RepID=A0ABM1W409_APLCA|nr:uncharacterized protein LOC118478960 [Aplysia californica]